MILGLIPARLKSKRLKDKLLLKLKNIPLIIHTMKHASRSKKLIKTLNINKDYYSIQNQLKRLKINKNRYTYKQSSIDSSFRKKQN
jgi:CMP-2-keto-3-deoxyoctulosonic acid synthetase